MVKKKPTPKKDSTIKLPAEIRVGDLKVPKWSKKAPKHLWDSDFDLWYTERFGWCIPTLTIRNVPSRMASKGVERRSYGIALKDGSLVTIGMGPHVKRTEKVYVTEKNQERLKKLLDLKQKGAGLAGETRDRISTRRARSTLRRGGLFNW